METFHTRVVAWECDVNGHWNTRFHGLAFQSAAEVLAALTGDPAAARRSRSSNSAPWPST